MKYEQLVAKALKNISNQRTRDIISLRFGLRDGQRQTLEAIGQKYNITRERVRQIEEAAFSDLRESNLIGLFKPAFSSVDSFLNQEGKLAREERLLAHLTGFDAVHPDRGALVFILTMGQPYERFVESDRFYPLWSNAQNSLNKADNLIIFLVKKLKQNKELASLDHILDFSKETGLNLSKRVIASYLDATKRIDQNNFGQFGLIEWSEINPRGAKDKAYIVFKKQAHPLHFREVTDLINQANLGNSLAQPQTVHNELIKDERFVLVGRGTYALKEWGYQSGTVKEVITQALKKQGPLTREQILDKVLESRLVKSNTVLINLQNKKHFVKQSDNRYKLVK
jgi:hypothetical protein|tara:strand:+ start:1555 stop:2574 length:1020 start_codon:yes stop_codon:yes gene_type:complete